MQTSGGRVVGCAFYPITVGFANEHLPTGGYPSGKVVITRYRTPLAARQVLAAVARAGGAPSLQHVDGLVAETFRTRFYPPDADQDWACAFIKGSLLAIVYVADQTSSGQQNTLDLAGLIAPRI